jgi:glutamine synthetase
MTTDLQAAIAERAPEFERILADYSERGVEFIQVHFPDLSGLFRTKYAPFKVSAEGESLNAILYNVAHSDGAPIGDVVFDAPICSLDNGFPSIQALVDPATAVVHGWRPNTASMLLNSYLEDGSTCSLDARARLKHFEDKARSMGFVPQFAFEYEFGIFHYDEELVQAGRFAELRPHGKSFTNYDILVTRTLFRNSCGGWTASARRLPPSCPSSGAACTSSPSSRCPRWPPPTRRCAPSTTSRSCARTWD